MNFTGVISKSVTLTTVFIGHLEKSASLRGEKKDKIKKKGVELFKKKKGFQTDYYRNCGLKQSNSSCTFQSACVAREQMRIFIEDRTKGKRRKGKEKKKLFPTAG